jgi:hypothetical protein
LSFIFSSLSSSASINDKYRGKNVLGDEKVDYHKEGEALLQRLNLDSQTIGNIIYYSCVIVNIIIILNTIIYL